MVDSVLGAWISLARVIPRGGFPLVRTTAALFPALRRWPIELKLVPGVTVQGDLRESVWYALWKYGCYPHQMGEDLLVSSFLRPGDVAWDVGANIGYTALLYSYLVGASGTVVAFEPGPKAYGFLQQSTSGVANVETVNLAVSDGPGELWFMEEHRLDRSAVVPADSPAATTCVAADSLDSFASRTDGCPAPTFIKIDVEGHEDSVFRGAAKTIATHRPIIEFEALSSDELKVSKGHLAQFGGGEYTVYQMTHEGKLAESGPTRVTTHTSNFLALTPSHEERFSKDMFD